MVWKIKEMALMEKYRMCRGRRNRLSRHEAFVLFFLSALSAPHRAVAAVYIKRETTTERYGPDLHSRSPLSLRPEFPSQLQPSLF